MEKRTLILLSAPRCGSTAIFRMFQRHPDVGICDENPCVNNNEPHFWTVAAKAVAGDPEWLKRKMAAILPSIVLPQEYTEESMFALWNSVVSKQGPVVFEKSPFYLGDREAMALLKKYIDKGNDVRLFGLIRDPRDAIVSQYELWTARMRRAAPQKREQVWLEQYGHLEEMLRTWGNIPLFRYEDFVRAPSCYAPMVYRHCGIRDLPYTYDHLRPVSVGRKSASLYLRAHQWEMGREFKEHLRKYGYLDSDAVDVFKWILRFVRMLPGNFLRVILNIIRVRNRRYYMKQKYLYTESKRK